MRVGDELQEVPPGFTIGEVAPEYRWAIDPDTGIVMTQGEFLQDFGRWYTAHYTMQNPPQQVEGKPESIPGVIDFISKRVHPDDPTKIIPMDCDLNRPVISKPKLLYDQNAENPKTPEQVAAEQRTNDAGAQMAQLVQMHQAGDISDEVFMRRSKEIFGGSVVVGEGGADSAESAAAGSPPPVGFEPVPQKKDEPPPATEFAPESSLDPPETGMVKALCGKEYKAQGLGVHQSRCNDCKAIRESQEE
jgi:hypothetical protein